MVLYPTGKSSPLPVTAVGWHASDSSYNNITGHNSPEYDAIIAAMDSANTIEEQRLLIRDADFTSSRITSSSGVLSRHSLL